MKYIVIFSLVFLIYLDADQSSITSLSQSFKNSKYKKDLTRHQMLREAKYLNKKYKDAVLKLENWDIRKEELKRDFLRKNPHLETSFGTGNEYGKKRAQKRKREYYQSLDKQEGYLQNRVAEAETKLKELKEEFLFQFAVPLTDEEIKSGKAPEVTDRDEKVELLNNYINETDEWRKCKARVADFESVKNIASSIEKLFPDTKLTQLYIETKSSQNLDEIRMHSETLKKLEEEYKEKYGLTITNAARAKAIIQKIHSN